MKSSVIIGILASNDSNDSMIPLTINTHRPRPPLHNPSKSSPFNVLIDSWAESWVSQGCYFAAFLLAAHRLFAASDMARRPSSDSGLRPFFPFRARLPFLGAGGNTASATVARAPPMRLRSSVISASILFRAASNPSMANSINLLSFIISPNRDKLGTARGGQILAQALLWIAKHPGPKVVSWPADLPLLMPTRYPCTCEHAQAPSFVNVNFGVRLRTGHL
jgi:hypothetical protein